MPLPLSLQPVPRFNATRRDNHDSRRFAARNRLATANQRRFNMKLFVLTQVTFTPRPLARTSIETGIVQSSYRHFLWR